MGLFNWTEKTSATLDNGGVIAPDERLPWPQTTVMGVQHVRLPRYGVQFHPESILTPQGERIVARFLVFAGEPLAIRS